jgi:transposase-like protein
MKANLKLIKKRRKYSEEFKRNIVTEFESGSLSVSQISRLYTIAEKSIYRWIYKFSIFNEKESRIIEMKESSTKKLKELEKKVKELERIVGQKQISIDYLEKMIEIAKDELDIDIKKNYSTQRSSGSSKTKKK